jgi:hypothetical protein
MNMLSKKIMITNPNFNSMLKPNNVPTQFTNSTGQYSEQGIMVKQGTVNHQKAMVFDIIYDHLYRMLNQIPNSDDYISTSVKETNEDYKLLNSKKLEFFERIKKLIKFKNSYEGDNVIPYNTVLKNDLLYAPKDLIDEAFPIEFSLRYRDLLENHCEKLGYFDKVIDMFKEYNYNKYFFEYILRTIFYGKEPSWENFVINIDLNSVFGNKERSIYIIKKWFLDSTDIELSLTYPITCFATKAQNGYKPKRVIMFEIPSVKPIPAIEYDKSTMNISLSLRNQLMTFYAHDARMCVHKFIPTKLYKMNSNEYFLGKQLLNNSYYHSRKKVYQSRTKYSMKELFKMLNLPIKDLNHNNTTHRRKAILKSLGKLHDHQIINIDKLNSERLNLNGVWNVNKDNCIQKL